MQNHKQQTDNRFIIVT